MFVKKGDDLLEISNLEFEYCQIVFLVGEFEIENCEGDSLVVIVLDEQDCVI